jgi:hypothetical protein
MLGTSEYDISKFCDQKAARSTVVYIADNMLREGDTAWARQLDNTIQATAMPSERISVVRLATRNGTAQTVWTGCWPGYTESQAARIRADGPYVFQKDPLKALETQRQVFRQQFVAALTEIFATHRRSLDAPSPGAENTLLIRAFADDKARYSEPTPAWRLLVFSNLIENSDQLGADESGGAEKARGLAATRAADLANASIYVFGAGGNGEDPEATDSAERFWHAYFDASGGLLRDYGKDLAVANKRPVRAFDLDVEATAAGRRLTGRLVLLPDQNGVLHDSYVHFAGQRAAAITGTFKCNGAGTCVLDAETDRPMLFDKPSEELRLEGQIDELTGDLLVDGATFPNGDPAAVPVTARLLDRPS